MIENKDSTYVVNEASGIPACRCVVLSSETTTTFDGLTVNVKRVELPSAQNDNQVVGVSLADAADGEYIELARSGARVPIECDASAPPAFGDQVIIADSTGIIKKASAYSGTAALNIVGTCVQSVQTVSSGAAFVLVELAQSGAPGSALLVGGGGTGLTSFSAAGVMLYASSTTALADTSTYLKWDPTNKGMVISPTGQASTGLFIGAAQYSTWSRAQGGVTLIDHVIERAYTGTDSGSIAFAKSRGDLGTPTAIAVDDYLGRVIIAAYDGASYQFPGSLDFIATTTDGTGAKAAFTAFASVEIPGHILSNQTTPILDDGSENHLNITGVFHATQTADLTGIKFDLTTDGSEAFSQTGLSLTMGAGYTGNKGVISARASNVALSTGANLLSLEGNIGVVSTVASASGSGHKAGAVLFSGGGARNIGAIIGATTAENSATNVGALILGLNTGSSPVQVGAHVQLGSAEPTYVSGALVVSNGSQTSPIFRAYDNTTEVLQIADGGTINLPLLTASTVLTLDSSKNIVSSSISSTLDLIGTEYNTTPITDGAEATSQNIMQFAYFTLPTTFKYYRITGIEWKNGATVAGNVGCGVYLVDADPPTQSSIQLLAAGANIAQSGTSAIQRNSRIASNLIPGGTICAGFFITANATGTYRKQTGLGSQNQNKAFGGAGYTGEYANQDITAFSAATERFYIKVYYKGI